MGKKTSGHGFTRRKTDAASAQPAKDRAAKDNAAPSAPDLDTADTEIIDPVPAEPDTTGTDTADPETTDTEPDQSQSADSEPALDTAQNASAHRKRPEAPIRAEIPPTTGAIPIERIQAPAAVDVYDYDIDRRSHLNDPPHTGEIQYRRRRTDPHDPPPRRRRERRRGRAGWIAATFIFVLLFGSAGALDWYLWNTAQEWEEHAHQLTEINYDLGARLSAEQQTTMQLSSEMDLLTQQLATSNQKVTALSAEKAGAVDESAIHLQEVEALEETLESAGSIANALKRCVDEQQQLAEYLWDAENYDPEDLEDFSNSVNDLCTSAEQAHDRLQEALNQ